MDSQGNEGDEKSGILSSSIEIGFMFPSRLGGKGLVMLFSPIMFSNCISLFSMRSRIRCLKNAHILLRCAFQPQNGAHISWIGQNRVKEDYF